MTVLRESLTAGLNELEKEERIWVCFGFCLSFGFHGKNILSRITWNYPIFFCIPIGKL